MEPIVFCQCDVQQFRGGGVSKWPQPLVRYHVSGPIGRVSRQDVTDLVPFATDDISAVCGLQFEYTSNPKTSDFDIVAAQMGAGGMGTPGQVLADATLPPPGLQQNSQFQGLLRVDPAEAWSSRDEMVNGEMPMRVVLLHEISHIAGLGHSPDPQDVMYSQLTRGVTALGKWSRNELVGRYGQPVPKPVPPGASDIYRIEGGFVLEWDAAKFGPPVFKRNGKVQTLTDSRFQ